MQSSVAVSGGRQHTHNTTAPIIPHPIPIKHRNLIKRPRTERIAAILGKEDRHRSLVIAVEKPLIPTRLPIRAMTPLVRVQPIKVGATVGIVATGEVAVHGATEVVVVGCVADGDGSVGVVAEILLEVTLDGLGRSVMFAGSFWEYVL